jgi:hypothetical protein
VAVNLTPEQIGSRLSEMSAEVEKKAGVRPSGAGAMYHSFLITDCVHVIDANHPRAAFASPRSLCSDRGSGLTPAFAHHGWTWAEEGEGRV